LDCLLRAEEKKFQQYPAGAIVDGVPVGGQFMPKGAKYDMASADAMSPEMKKEEKQKEVAKQKLLANPSKELSKIGEELASDPDFAKNIIKEVGLDIPEDEVKTAIVNSTKEMVGIVQAEAGESEVSLLEKVVSGAATILGGLGEDIRQGTGPHGVIAKVVGKAAAAVGITTAVLFIVGGGVTDLAFLGVNIVRALRAKGAIENGASVAGVIGNAMSSAFSKSVKATRMKNITAQNLIAGLTFRHFQFRLASTAVLEALTPGPGLAQRANFNNSYLKQAIDKVSGKKDTTEITMKKAELSHQKLAYIERITKNYSLTYAHSLEYITNAIQNAQSLAELEAVVDALITQEEERILN